PAGGYLGAMAETALPGWAQDIKSTYLRGESTVFLVHGNVYDLVLHEGEPVPLIDFLARVLLQKKDIIVHYNPTLGVKFRKKEQDVQNVDDVLGVKEASEA